MFSGSIAITSDAVAQAALSNPYNDSQQTCTISEDSCMMTCTVTANSQSPCLVGMTETYDFAAKKRHAVCSAADCSCVGPCDFELQKK